MEVEVEGKLHQRKKWVRLDAELLVLGESRMGK
jgi:hypothetical protein